MKTNKKIEELTMKALNNKTNKSSYLSKPYKIILNNNSIVLIHQETKICEILIDKTYFFTITNYFVNSSIDANAINNFCLNIMKFFDKCIYLNDYKFFEDFEFSSDKNNKNVEDNIKFK